MISLEEFALIFGEAFCKAASTLPVDDPRHVRAAYTNWSVYQQPDYYMYPGAWMFSYERTDLLNGQIGNTTIKPCRFLRQCLSKNGFNGTHGTIVEYASKYTLLPLKAPIEYLMESTAPAPAPAAPSDQKGIDIDKVRQSIQFYWDTIKNMKEYGDRNWSKDPIVKYLEDIFHVTDVIWIPNVGLMVEYNGNHRPELNSDDSTTVITLLIACGYFMMEHCKRKVTADTNEPIHPDVPDDALFIYLKYFMMVSVQQQIAEYQKTSELPQIAEQPEAAEQPQTAEKQQIAIEVDFSEIVANEFFRRLIKFPQKADELLKTYEKSYEDNKTAVNKIMYQLMTELVDRSRNRIFAKNFLK